MVPDQITAKVFPEKPANCHIWPAVVGSDEIRTIGTLRTREDLVGTQRLWQSTLLAGDYLTDWVSSRPRPREAGWSRWRAAKIVWFALAMLARRSGWPASETPNARTIEELQPIELPPEPRAASSIRLLLLRTSSRLSSSQGVCAASRREAIPSQVFPEKANWAFGGFCGFLSGSWGVLVGFCGLWVFLRVSGGIPPVSERQFI